MLFVRQARGNGKVQAMNDRIQEEIDQGESVLLIRKSGTYLVSKEGVVELPKQKKQKDKFIAELMFKDFEIACKAEQGKWWGDIWKSANSRKV